MSGSLREPGLRDPPASRHPVIPVGRVRGSDPDTVRSAGPRRGAASRATRPTKTLRRRADPDVHSYVFPTRNNSGVPITAFSPSKSSISPRIAAVLPSCFKVA
jgi:hypothetical protein